MFMDINFFNSSNDQFVRKINEIVCYNEDDLHLNEAFIYLSKWHYRKEKNVWLVNANNMLIDQLAQNVCAYVFIKTPIFIRFVLIGTLNCLADLISSDYFINNDDIHTSEMFASFYYWIYFYCYRF